MLRRLFAILAALSLALWILTTVMWVRSYFVFEYIGREIEYPNGHKDPENYVESGMGEVCWNWQKLGHDRERVWAYGARKSSGAAGDHVRKDSRRPTTLSDGYITIRVVKFEGATLFGTSIFWQPSVAGDRLQSLHLIAPYWLPTLLTAIAPGIWLYRRKYSKPAPGLCPKCGYDIRATPEAGGPLLDRCPECGMETQQPKLAG